MLTDCLDRPSPIAGSVTFWNSIPRYKKMPSVGVKRWPTGAAALAVASLCGACSSVGSPTTGPYADAADKEACQAAVAVFPPGTVPPGGYHVTIQEAESLEPLLRQGSGAILNEAAPLQQAINAEAEPKILQVFLSLAQTDCAGYGITFPT